MAEKPHTFPSGSADTAYTLDGQTTLLPTVRGAASQRVAVPDNGTGTDFV